MEVFANRLREKGHNFKINWNLRVLPAYYPDLKDVKISKQLSPEDVALIFRFP